MTAAHEYEVAPEALHDFARTALEDGYRIALVAAHDDREFLRVVYVFVRGAVGERREVTVRLDPHEPGVPTLSDLSFPAGRFEREMHDTFGIVPEGHPFLRPLVRHSHWPELWYPMRHDAGDVPTMLRDGRPYPYLEVSGTGVYEIPVGPVHAGLIEPGHFRFSVVGETILKMTARLWFLHRGIERMFEGRSAEDGVAIAERISGDTAVGHTLAYCAAIEDALGVTVAEESRVSRSVLLELERLYNHVGDVGALCSDVSFGVAHARAMVLRERLLRLNESVTGHRLLRGAIGPGWTSLMRLPSESALIDVERDFDELVSFILANSVVIDRFEGTAILSGADARAMGTLGVAARASGIGVDARFDHPYVSVDSSFAPVTFSEGDVLARFHQRVDEVRQSFALLRDFTSRPQHLEQHAPVRPREGAGFGVVEGWRGAVAHRVEVDERGLVTRCRVVDPSFFNWPALAVSLADTLVPDFPLVNKSFNLSYAGNDL
ncbi:MAG: NADH-quinone oxidoreductase subunit C [Acidimicrobiales bacterium]